MKNGSLIGNNNGPKKVNWCSSKSLLKPNIVIMVFAVTIGTLLAALFYFVFRVKIQVCNTPTCVRSSMEILQYIDRNANPCQDFYLFACGGFLQNTALDNRSSVSEIARDEIQSKIRRILEQPIPTEDKKPLNLARRFYKSCMNNTAIEKVGLTAIKQILKRIGGWPLLEGSNWNKDKFNWTEAMLKLRAMGVNFKLFFNVSVDKDKKNESKYILGIHDIFYNPSNISKDVKSNYLDYMVDVAMVFGADSYMARKSSDLVIDLLLQLANISDQSTALNMTDMYDLYTISELNHHFPEIHWFEYLQRLLAPAVPITYDEVIVVGEPYYLKHLLTILKNTHKRTLGNFIAFHTVQHLMNFLPAKLSDKAYKFLEKVNGKMTREPRWLTCIKETQKKMDPVISAAFIEHFFDEYSRNDINQIIFNIKNQFKINLKEMLWLDETSKALIIEQLSKNIEDISSFSDLMEVKRENQEYQQAEVDENRVLQSALNLDFINLNLKFGMLRKPVKENWLRKSSFVTDLYVYYFPKENILRFPVGIFGGVYYQQDRPRYLNYGALGTIIAHELSHILMQARDRDQSGDLRSRWSTFSLVNYYERLECLSEQYGKFEIGELNKNVDPQKTREEDMADLAGVKVAYDTYMTWVYQNEVEPRLPNVNYTSSQLFWISSAIRHCAKYSVHKLEKYIANYKWSPPQFRVNGPLQNLEEFSSDFNCPVGSKMNPYTKCFVW